MILLALIPVWAQTGVQTPANAGPNSGLSIAYETANLPQDRVQAWEMLRAGSGLVHDALRPWYLHAHYKTYDAYGKPERDGTFEYVWMGALKWRYAFIEGADVFALWRTDKGTYLKGTASIPPYPAYLIPEQFLYPLGSGKGDTDVPAVFATENLGKVTLSCFDNGPSAEQSTSPKNGLRRACTALGKPLLLLSQGNYDVFFEKQIAFQHEITAKRILIRDGTDMVADIDLDVLRSPTDEEMKSLDPPPEATFSSIDPQKTPTPVVAGHLVKRVDPSYPLAAKQKRVQGTVRLAAVIGTDGKMKNLKVLHSPDPDLAGAALEAVKKWQYTPYFIGGKPVEVSTQVKIGFALNR